MTRKRSGGPDLIEIPNLNIEGSAYKQVQGILHDLFEGLQELRADGAVDHSMIAGHSHAHRLSDGDLVLLNDGFWGHRADGQDRSLRGIDHRRELLDTK